MRGHTNINKKKKNIKCDLAFKRNLIFSNTAVNILNLAKKLLPHRGFDI